MTDLLKGPMFRLNVVIMSSLALLAFGLRTPSGPIEVLQLPVAFLQVYFICATVFRVGWQGFIAPLTRLQWGLVATLMTYVMLVSLLSPVASAAILAMSWVIHILFFVVLIAFFKEVGLNKTEVVWAALGITALIQVCAFLFVLVVWPEPIYSNVLPAFGNIRHLGYLLAPAAAVMAMIFLIHRKGALLPLACFSAATFYILYTGSRGGAVALLAGLTLSGAHSVLRGPPVHLSRVWILLVAIGALIAVSELLPSLPWPPVFSRGVAAMDQTRVEMLQGRGAVWQFVMQTIQKNWLWGYGPALMSDLPDYPIKGIFYQPHNIGLQLLLHWGVLGNCLVLATIGSFGSYVSRALRTEPRKAVFPLAVISTICIHALVDGSLFYPFTVVIALVAFAMLVAMGQQNADQTSYCDEATTLNT